MIKRAWKFVRENAGAVVSLLSLLGFGSAVAFADDARQALASHPGSVLLLSALAFVAGAALAAWATTRSRWARRRARHEELLRLFAPMSRRRREMVATALDEGELMAAPALDEDADALVGAGVLVMPPHASPLRPMPLSVSPEMVLELIDDRDELLGM